MRKPILWSCWILAIWPSLSPSQGEPGPDVSIVARSRALNLQLVVADTDDPSGERWIVWDERSGSDATAHIALCSATGVCRWHHEWTQSYEPTIRYVGRWSTDTESVFLVTYNEGAEAETAVAIGWSSKEAPVIYDTRDGAWITLAPDEMTLEINTSSGAGQTLACFDWNMAAKRFHDATCTWLPSATKPG